VTHSIRRREFLQTILTAAAGAVCVVRPSAQGRGAPPALTVTKVTDRIAVVGGAGGNIGVIVGADGLVMIDGGTANRAMDVAASVGSISPHAVQVLFNTHYHFDHVGSNETLGARQVRIIAHDNVRTRLSTTFDNPAMGRRMDALQPAGLPTETFTTTGRFVFGADPVEYTHVPRAHTDGDAWVFLPASNVLHAGDLLWSGRYPVIDYTVGGSLARMAASLGQIDGVGDARTRVIPGHGPASISKDDMRRIRETWLTIDERLQTHAKQGHSLEEVLAARPTADFDATVGSSMSEPFLRQAYGALQPRP
jgi:glyoxylase-like metal-dependent hydrolase (beta-lactamase superfamily II)